jgi:hypothetical protein
MKANKTMSEPHAAAKYREPLPEPKTKQQRKNLPKS